MARGHRQLRPTRRTPSAPAWTNKMHPPPRAPPPPPPRLCSSRCHATPTRRRPLVHCRSHTVPWPRVAAHAIDRAAVRVAGGGTIEACARLHPHAAALHRQDAHVHARRHAGYAARLGFRFPVSSFPESRRAWPPPRSREDGLVHPAETSRSNLAAALALCRAPCVFYRMKGVTGGGF